MTKDGIEIIYEDEHILAINKPAGLVVHADGKISEPSVADWVLRNFPDMRDIGESWIAPDGTTIYRPGIVHRLDRDTSGALLLCKDQETFIVMKEKFQGREVSKIYHAFVYGEMKDNEGTIDRPIARSRKDFRLWSAQRGARGNAREAITDFKVLRRGGGCSFVELKPRTGRTHQLRVHLKAINHPIVCDGLYAPKREPVFGLSRLALHASSVSFEFLSDGEISITAPLPAEFEHALAVMAE